MLQSESLGDAINEKSTKSIELWSRHLKSTITNLKNVKHISKSMIYVWIFKDFIITYLDFTNIRIVFSIFSNDIRSRELVKASWRLGSTGVSTTGTLELLFASCTWKKFISFDIVAELFSSLVGITTEDFSAISFYFRYMPNYSN